MLLGKIDRKEVGYFFSFIKRRLPFDRYELVKPADDLRLGWIGFDTFLELLPKEATTRHLLLKKSEKPFSTYLAFSTYRGTVADYGSEEIGWGSSILNRGGWVQYMPKSDKRKVAQTMVHELAHSLGLVRRHKDRHCENKNCIMYLGVPAPNFCARCTAELNRFK